jgi:hypothetical protein
MSATRSSPPIAREAMVALVVTAVCTALFAAGAGALIGVSAGPDSQVIPGSFSAQRTADYGAGGGAIAPQRR